MNNKSVSALTILRIAMVVVLLIFVIFLQAGDKTSSASLESVSEKVLGAVDQEKRRKTLEIRRIVKITIQE